MPGSQTQALGRHHQGSLCNTMPAPLPPGSLNRVACVPGGLCISSLVPLLVQTFTVWLLPKALLQPVRSRDKLFGLILDLSASFFGLSVLWKLVPRHPGKFSQQPLPCQLAASCGHLLGLLPPRDCSNPQGLPIITCLQNLHAGVSGPPKAGPPSITGS